MTIPGKEGLKTAGYLSTLFKKFQIVDPPPFAPIVQPARGLLVTIPAHAVPLTIVFSGVSYLIKASSASGDIVEERRLPKKHEDRRITCDDLFPGHLIRGLKASRTPHVLFQLTFRAPSLLALFVPTPESHPWREDDPEKAFSSRPGFVHTVVSASLDHAFQEFSAAEAWSVLGPPVVVPVPERRGLKRVREATTLDDDDGDPMPLETDHDASTDIIGHLDRWKQLALNVDMAGSGSFLSPPIMPSFEKSLPRFFILQSHTPSFFRVISSDLQHAFVYIHTANNVRGLCVRTTGVYFCHVHPSDNSESGFELQTVHEYNPPLDDLSDKYFTPPDMFEAYVAGFEQHMEISLGDLQSVCSDWRFE